MIISRSITVMTSHVDGLPNRFRARNLAVLFRCYSNINLNYNVNRASCFVALCAHLLLSKDLGRYTDRIILYFTPKYVKIVAGDVL